MPENKILVVDDDDDFRNLLVEALEMEKYKVLPAQDGFVCLELAKKEKPDLIVLDVMMPKMDGYQTCMKLQQDPELASIPVLMLTAKTQTVDKFMGLFAGAVEYMCKPVKIQAFLETVKVLLSYDKGRPPSS